MYFVISVLVGRGFRFSNTPWVDFMRLPLGSMTWGPLLLAACCYMGCLP